MISLLVYLLILCLVGYLIWYVLNLLPLPPPIRLVIIVIFAIIVILFLLQFLPPMERGPYWR